MIRKDLPDLVYMTERKKFRRSLKISKNVLRKASGAGGYYLHRKIGAGVKRTDQAGIKHNVLNAKFHANEAAIVLRQVIRLR